jgi:hypothetical protein
VLLQLLLLQFCSAPAFCLALSMGAAFGAAFFIALRAAAFITLGAFFSAGFLTPLTMCSSWELDFSFFINKILSSMMLMMANFSYG